MRHQLNARVEGVPGATPLLLLHGFLSSNLQWEPNLDGLRPWFRLIGV